VGLQLLKSIPTPRQQSLRFEWLGSAEDYLVLREKHLLERFIDREELMRRAQDL